MQYDLIVIGSGPGGYVAAIRASQLGMKTAVVEKSEVGGICLNWGCIPTKALLKSAQVYHYAKHAEEYGIQVSEVRPDFQKVVARSRGVAEAMSKGIQFLFKKNKIDVIQGFGKLVNNQTVVVKKSDGSSEEHTANHIILATGARSKELPHLKQDGKKIIGYREALTLSYLPKSMVVVGSGAIGSEFAYFYNAMGTKVTIVEFLPNIIPLEDEEVSKNLARSFKKEGIEIITEGNVTAVDTTGSYCQVTVETKQGIKIIEAEVVLSAVGVTHNLENIGIEELGIELEKGKIKVNDFYETNIKGVYAIGDIVHGPALAHVASAEGICCVEHIAGTNPVPVNYKNIPSCIYTSPEVASVGLTEKQAIEQGYEIKVGKFPYSASGKAKAAGNSDGFVKLIFDAKYGELLGAHLIGLNVTEMIAELVVSKTLETTGHELIKSIHPHPTMSEAIMEAAAAAYGEVIHL
ncbi:MAG TPA: dihydrolipoyl dehydrogenase [Bacteroidales bacterium]|nr:dihydrolipoyl dehydrogenase [Bacteroidales bacterium]